MHDEIKTSTKPAGGSAKGAAGPKQDEDLRCNPGIGQSIGTSEGGDVDLIEGENTVEGDTDNNAGRFGQVKIGRERTNK